MGNDCITFIQQNSPDGGFFAVIEWKKFQESVGRKPSLFLGIIFRHNIIEHYFADGGGSIFLYPERSCHSCESRNPV